MCRRAPSGSALSTRASRLNLRGIADREGGGAKSVSNIEVSCECGRFAGPEPNLQSLTVGPSACVSAVSLRADRRTQFRRALKARNDPARQTLPSIFDVSLGRLGHLRLNQPTMAITAAPPTPALPTVDRIEVKSIPLADAAEAAVAATPPEPSILKICPVISPPT